MLRENENYTVSIDPIGEEYIISNRKTHLTEARSKMLPEAFRLCDILNEALIEMEKASVHKVDKIPVVPTIFN